MEKIKLLLNLSTINCADKLELESWPLYSSPLCIGIGDSFASIIGSKFGKNRLIMNSKKTLEGFLASILSQTAFIKILEVFELIVISQKTLMIMDPWCINFHAVVVLVIITVSAMEVITTQVDNIALPILMYSLLRYFITWRDIS